MARRLSGNGLALAALLLALVWLALRSARRDALLVSTSALLREERRGCLYRQGLPSSGRLADNATYSRFLCGPPTGPLPTGGLCSVHRVLLLPERRAFVARVKEEEVREANRGLAALPWSLRATDEGWPECARYVDEAFVFMAGGERDQGPYFALHVSTFLPLYSLLALRKHLGPPATQDYTAAFFPAVEDYSLQDIHWSTNAFSEKNKFGPLQQMMEVFAGSTEVVPLTERWAERLESTICIRTAHFGVGVVNHSDPVLLHSFSAFIRSRLSLPPSLTHPATPLLCLVRRSSSPRILNEAQLVSAASPLVSVEVVELAALGYREQVAHMQKVTVLVGCHGDELLNALYLPRGGVAVQLLPPAPAGLEPERYALLLRARGPYLQWQDARQEVGGAGAADTVVSVEGFVELVKQALQLGLHHHTPADQ